ncbi:MAG: DUF4249 domain-containing protein [Bacteroidaceae bacterium]|nr:DUF4249 domain-containing protein [Bacteroidaceae bacterium]
MKIIDYILSFSFVLLACACERTIDFNPPEEATSDVVINAVAVADVSFSVYLNRAYPVTNSPSMQHMDFGSSLRINNDGYSFDYQHDNYRKETAITNAQVQVVVNGKATYDMELNEKNLRYTSAYVPHVGDRIKVKAITEETELYAEIVVPEKPKIEISSYEVIPENPYKELNGMSFGIDTIMRLTCKIHDSDGVNYYRLRVRSERDGHSAAAINTNDFISWIDTHYAMQDIFFSTDELFIDNRLTTNFGGWQAGFSNVFDNKLMSGRDYSFVVESPKQRNTWPSYGRITSETEISDKPLLPARVMVELQALSPELYRYLKSVELYRITVSDDYAEPIQIYSNVQNGWGILGALSYDRHFVEYGE